MKKRKFRFVAGAVIVVAAIFYFAISGFQEGKAYYRTLDELQTMGEMQGKRLRVGGVVAEGTIRREGTALRFVLEQDAVRLPVVYNGTQPVPDTFKDGVEAVVEGRLLSDGSFEADHIQAKCASKYEAKYGRDADASGSDQSS